MYLLAKEGEPSFRIVVTPAACAPQDLLVIVPWVLNNVISGSPRVFSPYIESSLYATEYRNYHWKVLRKAKGKRGIKSPSNVSPYPSKADQIADVAELDTGGNFGRFSRTGIMDTYLQQVRGELLCGIQAEYWLRFFRIFQDQKNTDSIKLEIDRLKNKLATSKDIPSDRLSPILSWGG